MPDPALQRALEALVDEAFDHLDAERPEQAQRCLDEAHTLAPDAPFLRSAQGQLWAHTAATPDTRAQAKAELQAALEAAPDDVEAHYTLARLHEDDDEHAEMIEHDLAVLRLDAAAARRTGLGGPDHLRMIEATAEAVLERIPEPFAHRIAAIPIVLEARPTPGLVRDGFDPRALGLFEGPEHGMEHASDVVPQRPTRIVLFYANLLAECPDDAELAEQVEITLLHEIGHYFGLDEDGVAALGLE